MVGNSRAVANTSLGQITLDPIKVNVTTSLNGLQGLNGYTTIDSVDVLSGTQQALNLGIDGMVCERHRWAALTLMQYSDHFQPF
jgi:hypothetical protein